MTNPSVKHLITCWLLVVNIKASLYTHTHGRYNKLINLCFDLVVWIKLFYLTYLEKQHWNQSVWKQINQLCIQNSLYRNISFMIDSQRYVHKFSDNRNITEVYYLMNFLSFYWSKKEKKKKEKRATYWLKIYFNGKECNFFFVLYFKKRELPNYC